MVKLVITITINTASLMKISNYHWLGLQVQTFFKRVIPSIGSYPIDRNNVLSSNLDWFSWKPKIFILFVITSFHRAGVTVFQNNPNHDHEYHQNHLFNFLWVLFFQKKIKTIVLYIKIIEIVWVKNFFVLGEGLHRVYIFNRENIKYMSKCYKKV